MRRLMTLALLVVGFAAQAEEPVEEAVPMDEFEVTSAPAAQDKGIKGNYAGYLLLEHRQAIHDTDPWQSDRTTLAEGNLNGSLKFNGGIKVYGDVTSVYTWDDRNHWTLNQVGLHYFGDHWQLSAGRELSRKSPGLILSPSDFIYADKSLPGDREQRQGRWQARAAYLTTGLSLEVLYLPNLVLDQHGLPDGRRSPAGMAARYFQQFGILDLALNYARLDDQHHIGGFVQGYAGKTFKLYLDLGYREFIGGSRRRALTGISYEALSDFTARVEFFYQDPDQIEPIPVYPFDNSQALLATGEIFVDHAYFITSLAWVRLWRDSSVIFNYVTATELAQELYMVRADLPLSSHQVIGLSARYLPRLIANQDIRVASVDWKYAF